MKHTSQEQPGWNKMKQSRISKMFVGCLCIAVIVAHEWLLSPASVARSAAWISSWYEPDYPVEIMPNIYFDPSIERNGGTWKKKSNT